MKTLRTPAQLCDHGLAPPEQGAALDAVAARYAVALPPALADLIDPNDPHDPIACQFVPDAAELDVRPQELSDPIGDDAHSPEEVVANVQRLAEDFETLAHRHGMEKIKTIGDAFVATANLLQPHADPVMAAGRAPVATTLRPASATAMAAPARGSRWQ